MTLKRANEIFRTKYPNGEITEKQEQHLVGSAKRFLVAFEVKPDYEELLRPWDKNCNEKVRCNDTKWYAYQCPSYGALLKRLGFENCLYFYEINNTKKRVKELKSGIELGGRYNILFDDEFIEYSPDEIEEMKKELEECENILSNVIEI